MRNAEYTKSIIENLISSPVGKDVYGGTGLAKLLFAPDKQEEGDAEVRRAAQWFELPHPWGRDPQGEPDFVARRLVRTLYMVEDRLSQETRDTIHRFFTTYNFESKYKSENHMLFFHASRYLYAMRYPDAYFNQYQLTAKQAEEEDRKFLQDFIRFRAGSGWAEFDSLAYGPEDFCALLDLMDMADPQMAAYARMSADLQLMDMLADTTADGLYGGAHGRIYEGQALDYNNAGMYAIYQYYFGDIVHHISHLEMALSDYEPSDYVYAMFAARPDTWENYETKHLHSITYETPHKQVPQVPGKIQKYTYITPKYVIGAVNHQDEYPEGSPAAWYAHHQQHEWDLSLCGGTDLKIFSHHPGSFGPEGKEHGYWTGDLDCCCGQFVCRKNIAMATYDIPLKEEARIHAHVPLTKLHTETDGNYLWFHKADTGVYGMLWMANGIEPGTEKYADIEVQSFGRKHGVVCFVGTSEEYESFEAFKAFAKAQPIAYDPEKRTLSFMGLTMDRDLRFWQGEPLYFPDATYESPMMHETWESGIVDLPTCTMDFAGWGKVIRK